MKNNKLVAILPAAGKGSRLGLPFSKELLPLFDKSNFYPVIKSSLDELSKVGVKKIIIVINDKKSDLIKYLGNGKKFGFEFVYAVQEQPKSLPHAIYEGIKFVNDENVIFMMPDTLISPFGFLTEFLSSINNSKYANIGCFKTNRPEKFAMVQFDENGIATKFEEKKADSKLSWMWGFWFWKKEVTSHLKSYDFNKNYDYEITLSEVMNPILEINQINVVKMNNFYYRDLGTFDEINEYISEQTRLKNEI